MSLRVWLPLNGDLRNNGLSDYSLSMYRGTETYNNSGKIGKCFYSNGVNTIKILNIIPDFYKYSEYSLCAWAYVESQNTSHSGSAIISAGNWNSQVLNLSLSDWSTDHYTKLRVSGTNWNNTYSYNFAKNTWYHIIVSSDGNKTYAYVNGTLIGNTVSGFLPSSIEGNDICIGGATYYGGMQFFGRINDVRIYDHVLSLKEIKELSKGLVCHYKLDGNGSGDNILTGTSNVEVQYEYPESSYKDRWSKKTSIIPTASQYTLSFYAKSTVNGDKVRAHFYSPNTTTKAETNQGVTNTSSDGNIDFTLSARWERYWVVWTQTAADATKSVIFPRMFSQASGQATGTGTVSIKCVKLEEGNVATAWKPNINDSSYHKLGYDSNIIYDCSGYGYDGINYNSTINNNSSKYLNSTFFDGSNSYIEFDNLDFMANMLPDEWSFSFWVFNQDSGDRSILFSNHGLGGVGGASFGFEKATNELLRVAYNNGTFDKVIPNSTLTVNDWTHIVVTKTKEHLISVYRNGVFIYSYTNDKCNSLGKIYRLGKDSRSDSTMFKGGISDFRIYSTVLSEDDAKELYQVGASIDKNGNVFAYEFKED